MNNSWNSISDHNLMRRIIRNAYARPKLKSNLWREENGVIFIYSKPGEPWTEIKFREDGSLNTIRSWS